MRDASNRTVASFNGEHGTGKHVFSWDGTDANGDAMPAGDYHIVITAKDTGGTTITPSITVRETIIRGVDFTGASPPIITDVGHYAISSQIQAVVGS